MTKAVGTANGNPWQPQGASSRGIEQGGNKASGNLGIINSQGAAAGRTTLEIGHAATGAQGFWWTGKGQYVGANVGKAAKS